MTFAPKTPVRERILLIGTAGSGKSTAVLDVALRIPEIPVYVVDTEKGGAWDRMNPGGEIPNIHSTSATTFPDVRSALKFGPPTTDSWLVVDMLGPNVWDLVQEYYTEITKGKDIEDYFLDFAKRGKKGNPFEGDTDWVAIKKLYNGVLGDILNFPGHVLCTAGVKALGERDDKDVRATFGHLGVRPEGEKHLPHNFSTILYFQEKSRGEYVFTTVRERNGRVGAQRPYVERVPWSDFSKQYLWEIAGWRPGR